MGSPSWEGYSKGEGEVVDMVPRGHGILSLKSPDGHRNSS